MRNGHRLGRGVRHVFNLFYCAVFIQEFDVVVIIELIQIVPVFQILIQVIDLDIDVDDLVVDADRGGCVMHGRHVSRRCHCAWRRGRCDRGHRSVGQHGGEARQLLRPTNRPYFLGSLRRTSDPVNGVLMSVPFPLGRGRTQRPSDVFMVIVIWWWNGKKRHVRGRDYSENPSETSWSDCNIYFCLNTPTGVRPQNLRPQALAGAFVLARVPTWAGSAALRGAKGHGAHAHLGHLGWQ